MKSESNRERVWVSVDSEGNELGYHVQPFAAEVVPEFTEMPLTGVGPVRVDHRLLRQTFLSLASGMAGAGIIEALIHH